MLHKKLKIIYAAGPGDVVGTFNYWNNGQDDPSQVSMTFSGQFFDVCEALDAEGYIISSNPKKKQIQSGRFTLEHRPISYLGRSTVSYYLGQIFYELGIVISALKYQADVVVGGNTECFFVLSLLPKLGIQVVPSLHCVLWPKYLPVAKSQKLLSKLNKRFFAKDCLAILSTSDDVDEQIKKITHNDSRPIVNFLSTYRRTEFDSIKLPNRDSSTFNVLFAGRIERDKGVFDLLEIAKRFKAEGRENIVFHVCGQGTELDSLRKLVKQYELESTVLLHGYCEKPEMRTMFSLSHIVIVPTTIDFIEGLNQVVVEGVLANRPVITSAVCPALSYVREAAVEVPPGDVQAYGDAILRLHDDRAFYQEKYRNCRNLQNQFYSSSHSWGTALKTVLSQLRQSAAVEEQLTV